MWGAALAVTLVLSAIAIVPTWVDPGNPQDEGLLLVEPERLLDGELPHRDFESFYGPANTQLLAGIYTVTGANVEAERVVGFVYRLALVAAVFALAAPAGIAVALMAGTIAGFFVAGPDALAWWAGVALAAWSLWLLLRAARAEWRPALVAGAGIAAGLAIAFRPQLAIAIGLAALPLLWGRPGRLATRFGLWTLVGALPLVVHTVLAGPGAVFKNLVVDAVLRSGSQSTIAPPSPSEPWGPVFILLLAALAAVLVGAVVAWRRTPRDPEARRLGALALFCVGLLPHALHSLSPIHIQFVACLVVPLAAVVLASPLVLGALPEVERRLGVAGLTALAFVLATSQSVLPGVEANYRRALGISEDPVTAAYDRRENWLTWEGREFPLLDAAFADQAREALTAVDVLSDPGDRLVVGSNDLRRTFYSHTFLYYMLPELEPGTHHLTMLPGVANNEDSGLAGEVAAADVVVLGTGADYRQILPGAELGSDDAEQVLRSEFCLRLDNGLYRVFTKCEPAPEL